MYYHDDSLANLGMPGNLSDKLHFLHQQIRANHDSISRVAIAVYDEPSDMLSTYIWSSDSASPLTNYQARLSESESLVEILKVGKPRVVNDMRIFADGSNLHTQILADTPYLASYTMPLFAEGQFLGFVFFNAEQLDVFNAGLLRELDMIGHMISLLLYNEISKVRTLVATVRSAQSLTHSRDPETGAHLDRMSRYSRLIARQLASKHQLTDDYINHLFLFAPLHDLGKIAIPDDILLKPAKLDDSEFSIMQTHTTKGRAIIDRLLENYGLNGVDHINMLRNIALYHHEAVDGSGYPDQLSQEDIPLESRIVAVADVFDALTSARPYKPAWSNDQALAKLMELAGNKLDAECVAALAACRQEVEEIQRRFKENTIG